MKGSDILKIFEYLHREAKSYTDPLPLPAGATGTGMTSRCIVFRM
jgi:hypothetical protein